MTQDTATRFQRQVERTLKKANVPFSAETSIGGLRPDILVRRSDGDLIIIETKVWAPTPENIARAHQQANLYRRATGASRAFIVLKNLKKSFPKKGVVRRKDVPAILRKEFRKAKPKGLPISQKARGIVFAAMPFKSAYDDVFFVAIAHAAKVNHLECRRIDTSEFEGDIVEEIKRLTRKSMAVVADLSEANANVMYEVGFAHALSRPTIHICSTPLGHLPFDVRNWRTIKYKRGQTHRLGPVLAKRLKGVLRKDS